MLVGQSSSWIFSGSSSLALLFFFFSFSQPCCYHGVLWAGGKHSCLCLMMHESLCVVCFSSQRHDSQGCCASPDQEMSKKRGCVHTHAQIQIATIYVMPENVKHTYGRVIKDTGLACSDKWHLWSSHCKHSLWDIWLRHINRLVARLCVSGWKNRLSRAF